MIGARGMRSLLLVGIGAAVLFLALTVSTRSGLGWLARSDAAWIVYPHVVRTTAHSDRLIEATFERRVELAQAGDVVVELDCLGRCAVEIAGRPVERGTLPLSAGSHLVTLRAQRDDGPPAVSLQLRAGVDGPVIARSDSSWLATLDGAVRVPAAIARVPRRPESAPLPAIPWPRVVALGFMSVAILLVAGWRGARWGRALLPAVMVAWIVLFVANSRSLPGLVGFDVEHHLAYLQFVTTQWAIPSPSDGIQTYQPPLFYLLSAVWLEALGQWAGSAASVLSLRALGVVLGLFHLVGLYACVRLVLPGREEAAALALVFAAALPLHLTLFHSFSNEVLVAALSTATVWTLLWSLQGGTPTARQGLAVGLLAGAALLAKLSALVLLPIVLGVLWLRSPRAAAPFCLLGAALSAGWYYAGVAAAFGTPFVGNWDPRVGFIWWQDPGFGTSAAYLHFGRALFEPWFAGFDSVWDGFYSTLFADGLASGEPTRLLGPAWNHGLTRVAVWLALVPTSLVVLGGVRGGWAVWRRPDARGLALVGLAVAMSTAFVFMTLRVPSYAQAKANYLTPALVVVVLALALGVDAVRSRSLWGGRLTTAGLVLWAVVSYAVFWIDPDAVATLHSGGERELARGRPAAARALFERAAAVSEDGQAPVWAEVGRCRSFAQEGRVRRAMSLCEAGLARAPDDPDALFHTASVARRRGELERAFALFERLRAVAPLDARGPPAVASLARRLGHAERAERAAREWLRFDPGNPRALTLLSDGQSGSRDGS